MPRAPGLVGSRDAKDTPISALSAELERPQAVEVRHRVSATCSTSSRAAPRPAPRRRWPAAVGADDAAPVVARLDWAAPRRSARLRGRLAAWTLREAAWLGVTGAGAVSGFGAALLGDRPRRRDRRRPRPRRRPDVDAGADALDAALPDPVDHVLLQADLTAVAPGPLEPAIARELALAADVESRGGATVYRFTPASVRRALDAGRTGEELLRELTTHSRTPVPQPLEYLVDRHRAPLRPAARRRGRLVRARGGPERPRRAARRPARRRRCGCAGSRRRSLAAQAAPDAVLTLLRDLGLTPAAESAEGDLLVRRPDARRTEGRRVVRSAAWPPPAPSRRDLLAGVARLRAGDAVVAAPAGDGKPGGPPPLVVPMDPAGSLAVLRDAVSAQRTVWISYLEDADRHAQARIRPLGVEAGRVRAVDLATGRLRLLPGAPADRRHARARAPEGQTRGHARRLIHLRRGRARPP